MTVKRLLSIILTAAVVVALLQFPLAKLWIGAALTIYGVSMLLYPYSWLSILLGLLPVLDLAPWTGWFFFDAFDFFVLSTLAVGLWRNNQTSEPSSRLSNPLILVLIFLTLSHVVSILISLLPLQPIDANAFSNYYSHYNSLRAGKGYFEVLALFLLFWSQADDKVRFDGHLVTGMMLGLGGLVLAVVWERFRFSGLLNFASVFRVTATFSGLHNGGNDLEAYLVLAQPFILAWVMLRRKFSAYLLGLGLFILATYALLVTFSRAGYLALVVSWTILLICLVVSLGRRSRFPWLRVLTSGMLLSAVALAVIIPVVKGGYIESRFAVVKEDWIYRLLQSRNTIKMMDSDWQASLFGMGVGSFPEMFYLRKPLPITPGTYRYEKERDNLFLRLTSGSAIYVEQVVRVRPYKKYLLSLSLRSTKPGSLIVFICEKTLQYSFRCSEVKLGIDSAGSWQQKQVEMETGAVGSDIGMTGWFSRRPVRFSLYNSGDDSVVDVDNVRLIDDSGHNILMNGDFSQGHDRWFFSADDHIPWQNWNHWVQIYFEQGWVGVASLLCLVVYTLVRLFYRVAKGDWFSSVPLASILLGFFAAGIFGSLFDTPRMAMLFFLISFFSCHPKISEPSRLNRN